MRACWRRSGTRPRAAFVSAAYATRAYDDAPIPIPHQQVTTQPSLSAAMIAALGLTGTEEVFEVGTGYGYQTALLARLAARVISIDIRPDLTAQARRNLTAQGIGNVVTSQATEPRAPRISPRSTRSWSAPPTLACRRRWPPSSRSGGGPGPAGRPRGRRTCRSVPEGEGQPAANADRDGGELRPALRQARFPRPEP